MRGARDVRPREPYGAARAIGTSVALYRALAPAGRMHILIPDDLPPEALDVLSAEGWTTDARTGRSAGQLREDVAIADAIIVRSATTVDDALIAAAPRLRVIARAGVGVDNVDLAAAHRRGVVVMNAPEATTTSVAELTLAGLLALARQVCAADRAMKAQRWEKKTLAGTELCEATLGIVGFGRIGRAVARLARAFGMHVVAHDPIDGAPEPGVERVALAALCATADYITLHVPVTGDTHGLFDAARLASCRRGVRLVNTARGELVDAAALVAALESGQVGGAAIDVYAPEPPVDWTLARHPRVVATPHLAASTREAQVRVALETAAAVRDYLRDGHARNVVSAG